MRGRPGFGQVWVPAVGVHVPNWILAGFKSQSEVTGFTSLDEVSLRKPQWQGAAFQEALRKASVLEHL